MIHLCRTLTSKQVVRAQHHTSASFMIPECYAPVQPSRIHLAAHHQPKTAESPCQASRLHALQEGSSGDLSTSSDPPVTHQSLEDEEEAGEDEEEDGELSTSRFTHRHFQLVPCEGGETTIQIDGVKMHISASKLPSQDAKDKVKLARIRKKSVVLDICTGLGYSAIAAMRAGAAQVISLEREQDVLDLAKINPMSEELFSNPNIRIIVGDASETIERLGDGVFSSCLHDPPRMAHAGELYGLRFFQQIHRVLRDGGRLVMYTGTHRSRSGIKSMPKGVKDRLLAAGFIEVKFVDSCQGFVASKL